MAAEGRKLLAAGGCEHPSVHYRSFGRFKNLKFRKISKTDLGKRRQITAAYALWVMINGPKQGPQICSRTIFRS